MNTRTLSSGIGTSFQRSLMSPPSLKVEAREQAPQESFKEARQEESTGPNLWKVLALGGLAATALAGCTQGPSVPDPVVEVSGNQLTDQDGRTLYADDGIDLAKDGTYLAGPSRGIHQGAIGG